MVDLSDIINLIWVDGDKPIHIITSEGECLNDDEDLTDVLTNTVTSITVYDSCVEIELGE